MAEDHLNHDEFFTKLAELLQQPQNKGHGSVLLTQKRLSYGEDNKEPEMQELNRSLLQNPQFPDQAPSTTLPIIIRATNGNTKTKKGDRWVVSKQSASKRVKLSTVVKPEDLDAFYAKYAEVCKAGMGALKKRDRSKRKKKEKKKKGDSKG